MMLRDHTPQAEVKSLIEAEDSIRQEIDDVENTIIRISEHADPVPDRLLNIRDDLHDRLIQMGRRRYSLELAIRRGDIDTTIH